MNNSSRTFRDLNEVKEAVRERVSLVEYIGKYVTLENKGKHWWGLCPFHGEKTASFTVTPHPTGSEIALWSCFGCHKHGDIFSFVQEFHAASFPEAIEIIAEVGGINLEAYYRPLTPEEQFKEAMYQQIEEVADWLHEQLLRTPTQMLFFNERGIEAETLAKFKVGYCPSVTEMEQRFGTAILEYVEPNRDSRKAVFDHNIVYPQFTAKGRIWGFYGRTSGQPKYLGTSSNAPLFQGMGRLYGLHLAKQIVRRAKQPFVIVEGFNDTLALHQADFPGIALCGTQLSADQIQAFSDNSIRECIEVLDGDSAGFEAMLATAKRAHEIKSTNFKFARIPGDPDEFIAERGRDAFGKVLEQSLCAIEFVITSSYNLNGSSATAQLDFLHRVSPDLLAYPRTSIYRELGIQTCAKLLGISCEAVADFLEQFTETNTPVNLRGEQVVLAEFAHNPQAWVVYPDIRASDFYFTRYRKTFELAQELYETGETVNPDLLAIEAERRNLGQHVLETIEQLRTVDRTQASAFAIQVHEKGARREAQQMIFRANTMLNDPSVRTDETLTGVADDITRLLMGHKSRGLISSVTAATIVRDQLLDKMMRDDTQGIVGLDLGSDWSYLMNWINGFRPGRVHLVCAVSGVGKSIVTTANWAYHLSVCPDGPRVPGLAVSMEMDAAENVNRIIAIDSGVPHKLIDRGRFQTDDQRDLVTAAIERYAQAQITWMEGIQNMRDIYSQARSLKSRGLLEYVMIDYVQLLDTSIYNDRWAMHEKFGAASNDMLELAKSLQVPVLACAQLSKQAYQEEVAGGEQMGSSYKIYQDAHVCLTLNPRKGGNMFAYLDKNRGGVSDVGTTLFMDRNEDTSTLRIREVGIER